MVPRALGAPPAIERATVANVRRIRNTALVVVRIGEMRRALRGGGAGKDVDVEKAI